MLENKDELLKFILESGTVDLVYIQEQMEMQKRKEILNAHKYSIWYREQEEIWCTTVPDYTKKSGRKKIKRKNRDDLEKAIVDEKLRVNVIDWLEKLAEVMKDIRDELE